MSPFTWKLSNQYSTKRIELPVCSDEEQLQKEEQKSLDAYVRQYESCHDRMNELINMPSLDSHQISELEQVKKLLEFLIKKLGGLENICKLNVKKLHKLYSFPD